MPMGMAGDILENADISVFVGQGGAVECELEDLKSPDCPVYFSEGPPLSDDGGEGCVGQSALQGSGVAVEIPRGDGPLSVPHATEGSGHVER